MTMTPSQRAELVAVLGAAARKAYKEWCEWSPLVSTLDGDKRLQRWGFSSGFVAGTRWAEKRIAQSAVDANAYALALAEWVLDEAEKEVSTLLSMKELTDVHSRWPRLRERLHTRVEIAKRFPEQAKEQTS